MTKTTQPSDAKPYAFWILIVACVFLAYALYFAFYALTFSLDFTHNTYVYNLVTKNPWWWQILYYGSEGIAGTVGIFLRAAAAFFALYSAVMFWRKGDAALPKIKRKVATAIALEAGFFLALIPSVIAAFAYNLSNEYLFYFDHTPELILLYGTAIPCLAMVLAMPPLLLKLRTKILHDAPRPDIVKWTSLTGLGYLFVVFWFNYSMLWAANLVSYPRAEQQFGWAFLLQPTNFVSFAVTAFGLLAIAVSALVFTYPAIKKRARPNLRGVGAVMTVFGSYFVFNTLFYYATGGYEAHPSVWYEVIGPLHNPNLWCMAFIFLGVALLIREKRLLPR